MSKPAFKAADAAALVSLAAASILGINQYAYGLYNHCITIPFIKSLLYPDIYTGDYLIAELKYFYSLFLPVCSFLIRIMNISLPTAFFAIYSFSLYATLVAFFLIALKLFERRDVAYFATMFLIFSFTTLGQEKTVENILMERTFALPLLLFSLYTFLSSRIYISAFLAGIAFLFHPLSASYVIMMLVACCLYRIAKEGYTRRFLIGGGILAAVVSPLFILKLENPAPGLQLLYANHEWVKLLMLRSPHHVFPSSWDMKEVIQALMLVGGFIIAWKYKPRPEYHLIVTTSSVTLLALFVTGTIFTEIIPVSIVLQFQLFRGFKFLVFFAIIYYANFLFSEPNSSLGIARKLLVTVLILAPYVHESKEVLTGLILMLLSAFAWLWVLERKSSWKHAMIPAQLVMLIAMGIFGSMSRVNFTISNAQEKSWLSAQQWARENTPKDAVFIVPPYLEGFRVESERTLYGEWKDGTQMFFHPKFGNEWMRRMKMMGYNESTSIEKSYNSMRENDFKRLASEMKSNHSKIYAVITAEHATLALPELYSNNKFSVYEVPSVEVAEFDLVKYRAHELVAQSAEVGD